MLAGLCTCCRCELHRQWVATWAVSLGVIWDGLRALLLWLTGMFRVQCSVLHRCAFIQTFFAARTTKTWPEGWNFVLFPMVSVLGETSSEATVSFLYLPLPILGGGRWRSCGGYQTALPTSPLKGVTPTWRAGHCGSTFLWAGSAWGSTLEVHKSPLEQPGSLWWPREATVLLALLQTARNGTARVLSGLPVRSWGPVLVPCGRSV